MRQMSLTNSGIVPSSVDQVSYYEEHRWLVEDTKTEVKARRIFSIDIKGS